MLIPIETYYTCDFHSGSGGMWGSGPLVHHLYLPMSFKEYEPQHIIKHFRGLQAAVTETNHSYYHFGLTHGVLVQIASQSELPRPIPRNFVESDHGRDVHRGSTLITRVLRDADVI